MRVLVVYSHPVETSYNAALHREVSQASRAGHDVDDCDLYAETSIRCCRGPTARLPRRSGEPAPVRRYVERLRWAEALVFCFPTWCFGCRPC